MGETDGPPGGEQVQAEPAPVQFGTMPDVESTGCIPAASHGGGMPDVESKAASPSVSHAASQTGARADQALFAEALQAAEELQNVASYGTPGLGATSGFASVSLSSSAVRSIGRAATSRTVFSGEKHRLSPSGAPRAPAPRTLDSKPQKQTPAKHPQDANEPQQKHKPQAQLKQNTRNHVYFLKNHMLKNIKKHINSH